MRRAFYRRARFDEDLSRWNVSHVTDIHMTRSWMFRGATQVNRVPKRTKVSELMSECLTRNAEEWW
jgi:hypothetical protein